MSFAPACKAIIWKICGSMRRRNHVCVAGNTLLYQIRQFVLRKKRRMSIRRALAQVVSGGKCNPHNKKGSGSLGGDLLGQPWLCGQDGLFESTESWTSVNTSRVNPCFAQKANVHVASTPVIQSALFPFQSLRNALRTPLQPQQYVGSSRLVSATNAFRSPRNGCKATFASSQVHSDQDRTEDHGATDKLTLRKHGKCVTPF